MTLHITGNYVRPFVRARAEQDLQHHVYLATPPHVDSLRIASIAIGRLAGCFLASLTVGTREMVAGVPGEDVPLDLGLRWTFPRRTPITVVPSFPIKLAVYGPHAGQAYALVCFVPLNSPVRHVW
jgi:hypothetical protein